jgi:hypothetical protein
MVLRSICLVYLEGLSRVFHTTIGAVQYFNYRAIHDMTQGDESHGTTKSEVLLAQYTSSRPNAGQRTIVAPTTNLKCHLLQHHKLPSPFHFELPFSYTRRWHEENVCYWTFKLDLQGLCLFCCIETCKGISVTGSFSSSLTIFGVRHLIYYH